MWYGGGRLARDLTLPALRRGWRQDGAATERAVGSWRVGVDAPRSAAERQAEVEQRGLVWHRCTSEIERVRLQLRARRQRPGGLWAGGARGSRCARGVVD